MQAGRFGGKAGVKRASSAETGRGLAVQERRAASARINARADGSVDRILLKGAHTGALEMRRIEHRDACRREAERDMGAGRSDLRRIAATLGPSYPGAEERDDVDAYGRALASEMVGA
jgi:hypothetical protein